MPTRLLISTVCSSLGLAVLGFVPALLSPSAVEATPANRAAMPSADHARWPKPEQLAQAILWLASAENQLISGALVPVYGEG